MGRISFTADIWTDQSMRSFLAITAHWIASGGPTGTTLQLRSALIGFSCLEGGHDGLTVARAAYRVLERVGVLDKVRD